MESVGSRYEEQSVQFYAREVRPHLPAAVFQRTPARVLWLPLHLGIIVALATYIVRGAPPWYVAVGAALVVMVTFVGQWWTETRKPPVDEVASHLAALAWMGLRHLPKRPKLTVEPEA